jgi:hypothetical protein
MYCSGHQVVSIIKHFGKRWCRKKVWRETRVMECCCCSSARGKEEKLVDAYLYKQRHQPRRKKSLRKGEVVNQGRLKHSEMTEAKTTCAEVAATTTTGGGAR